DWARELICEPVPEHTRFVAGLSVLTALAPEEVIGVLRQRLERLKQSIDTARTGLTAAAEFVPRLFLIEDEYRIAMTQAEADWTQSLLDELVSGTFPLMDVWQKWHDTGEIPTEFADLAQYGAEQQ